MIRPMSNKRTNSPPEILGIKPVRSRTKVAKGRKVLAGVDGRSLMARRYHEVLERLVEDMGETPAESQLAIARRAALLAAWCEEAEARFVTGGPAFNLINYTKAANCMRGLLAAIDRRLRDVSGPVIINLSGDEVNL